MSMTTQTDIAELLDRLMVITEMLESVGSIIPSSDVPTPAPVRIAVASTEVIVARELIEMAASILGQSPTAWALADALYEATDPANYAATLTAKFITHIAATTPEPDPPKSEEPAP